MGHISIWAPGPRKFKFKLSVCVRLVWWLLKIRNQDLRGRKNQSKQRKGTGTKSLSWPSSRTLEGKLGAVLNVQRSTLPTVAKSNGGPSSLVGGLGNRSGGYFLHSTFMLLWLLVTFKRHSISWFAIRTTYLGLSNLIYFLTEVVVFFPYALLLLTGSWRWLVEGMTHLCLQVIHFGGLWAGFLMMYVHSFSTVPFIY